MVDRSSWLHIPRELSVFRPKIPLPGLDFATEPGSPKLDATTRRGRRLSPRIPTRRRPHLRDCIASKPRLSIQRKGQKVGAHRREHRRSLDRQPAASSGNCTVHHTGIQGQGVCRAKCVNNVAAERFHVISQYLIPWSGQNFCRREHFRHSSDLLCTSCHEAAHSFCLCTGATVTRLEFDAVHRRLPSQENPKPSEVRSMRRRHMCPQPKRVMAWPCQDSKKSELFAWLPYYLT